MKKLFRRLAGYVVTAYANRLYRKAVKIADKRHQDEKTMIYVISGYINPDDLVTCNRDEWRAMKKKAGIKDHIESLKAGCCYHTTDGIDRNGLPPIDKEARRLAFVRLLLKRAGLA